MPSSLCIHKQVDEFDYITIRYYGPMVYNPMENDLRVNMLGYFQLNEGGLSTGRRFVSTLIRAFFDTEVEKNIE